MTEPTDVFFPKGAVFMEMDVMSVTVYMAEPEVIKSTMCRVPDSYKGETRRFEPPYDG